MTASTLLQHRESEEAIQLLQHVVEAKEIHLPKLEALSYCHPGQDYVSPLPMESSLMQSLEKVGIATLTVHLGYRKRYV